MSAGDGTPLAYDLHGPVHGQPLVLCHGLAASGLQFAADAEFFAAQGFRVLVPDLRGHGQSGVPATRDSRSFAIPTLADDLVAMLDHAQLGPVHWVGNSLGGIVALDLVARMPERFKTLAMFGTAFSLNLPPALGRVLPPVHRLLGPRRLAALTAWSTTGDKAARKTIAAMAEAIDPSTIAAIAASISRYDLTHAATGFAGPMLVLIGGRDRAVNLALRPALSRIGKRDNFATVTLPMGGHCANLDATDDWRAALTQFWSAGL